MDIKYQILVFLLFLIWIILFFRAFLSKLKYFRIRNGKDYNGFEDLFSFFSIELWITGFIWFFPIISKDKAPEIIVLKRAANRKLISFYISILIIFAMLALSAKILNYYNY